MLNNKGFTLVELLAVFVVLGVLMAVTIPNIVGITTANKLQTYAEDAKKFKNSVEYSFRGDSTIEKPSANNECIIANLKYVAGSEFDNPPYGGKYMMNYSYVIMTKINKQYKYYVQLVEELPDGEGYRGIKLKEYSRLDGEKYQNEIDEEVDLIKFAPEMSSTGIKISEGTSSDFLTPKPVTASFNPMLTGSGEELFDDKGGLICNVIKRVYFES